MKDQGFDISDYYKVRDELGGNESFFEFVELAHQKGIKILFDVAINHTSIEHPWFQDAKKSKKTQNTETTTSGAQQTKNTPKHAYFSKAWLTATGHTILKPKTTISTDFTKYNPT